jgi:hypothetical protein
MFSGPSIGMPIILSLQWSDSINSTDILISTDSDPKVDDSTIFCALEYHQLTMIPVCDHRVTLLPAWLALTKAFICATCPLGSGALGGMASLAS